MSFISPYITFMGITSLNKIGERSSASLLAHVAFAAFAIGSQLLLTNIEKKLLGKRSQRNPVTSCHITNSASLKLPRLMCTSAAKRRMAASNSWEAKAWRTTKQTKLWSGWHLEGEVASLAPWIWFDWLWSHQMTPGSGCSLLALPSKLVLKLPEDLRPVHWLPTCICNSSNLLNRLAEKLQSRPAI